MDRHILQETAELAHLDLSEEELAAALPAFEGMLDFFALMMKADPSAGLATAAVDGVNSLHAEERPAGLRPRADNIKYSDSAITESLIAAAGMREGRSIIIPNVL